jgi:hypothetical protein
MRSCRTPYGVWAGAIHHTMYDGLVVSCRRDGLDHYTLLPLLTPHFIPLHTSLPCFPTSVLRHPDGTLLYKLSDWSPCCLVLREPPGGKVTSIAISPDGLRVSVCERGEDGGRKERL